MQGHHAKARSPKDLPLPLRTMLYTLIGKKVGMTQVYDEGRQLVPVTVIEAGPCPVTQIKTQASDGYDAVQIGFGKRKAKRTTKPQQGHFAKASVDPCQLVREVRGTGEAYEVGQQLTVKGFEDVAKVDVIAETKGKGFQGVVKRWGFAGGPASHGSMFHRRGGSFGQCQWPGEVAKGKKMPGRDGGVRRTVQNLKVVKVIEEKNLILVRGSVPGANGSYVLVRSALKAKKQKQAA